MNNYINYLKITYKYVYYSFISCFFRFIKGVGEQEVKTEPITEPETENVVTGSGRVSDVLAAEINDNNGEGTAEIDSGAAVNMVRFTQQDNVSNEDNVDNVNDNDFANDSDWESRPLRAGSRRNHTQKRPE